MPTFEQRTDDLRRHADDREPAALLRDFKDRRAHLVIGRATRESTTSHKENLLQIVDTRQEAQNPGDVLQYLNVLVRLV